MWAQHKRIILIVFAVLFLVAVFLIRNGLPFKKKTDAQDAGLAYSTATVGTLVNRDTDEDGVLDWEEGLWGTDPTKKETTPGTPDSVVVENLRDTQAASAQTTGDA